MARTSARAQALALQAEAHAQIEDSKSSIDWSKLEDKKIPTRNGSGASGVASPMMAASATQEILDKRAEDETSVAAHIERLNGGVSDAEFEKALHTVASRFSLPVKGVDYRTGEIVTWDLGKYELKDVLNAICYQHVRLLDKGNKYGSVARLQDAIDQLTEDQRALSEGGEISEQQAQRNMERVDYRELIVAGVKANQEIVERVYKERTGKDYERPEIKPTVAKAKVTDQSVRSKLLAEMSKRTKIAVVAPEGDETFDMAKHSADDRAAAKIG